MTSLAHFAEKQAKWLSLEKERLVTLRQYLTHIAVDAHVHTLQVDPYLSSFPSSFFSPPTDPDSVPGPAPAPAPPVPSHPNPGHLPAHLRVHPLIVKTAQDSHQGGGVFSAPADQLRPHFGDKSKPKSMKKPSTGPQEVLHNGVFSWLKTGRHDDKRRKLAEERRREYNEYLREKTKLEKERHDMRFVGRRENSNAAKSSLPEYSNVLEKKRNEEKKYREMNGLNVIEEREEQAAPQKKAINFGPIDWREPEVSPRITGKKHWFSEADQLNGEPDHITPRSRLLSTESSRANALRYREQLRQQVEEKRRRDAATKEAGLRDDFELERKIDEQRERIRREYEEEQMRLRKKTVEVLKKQEEVKIAQERNSYLFPSMRTKQLPPRSPSYLQVKPAKSMSPKTAPKNASRSLAFRNGSFASESRAAAIVEQTVPKRVTQSEANAIGLQPLKEMEMEVEVAEMGEAIKRPPNPVPPKSSDSTKSTRKEPNERILTRLLEVRQTMDEDHEKMIQRYNDKQKNQNEMS